MSDRQQRLLSWIANRAKPSPIPIWAHSLTIKSLFERGWIQTGEELGCSDYYVYITASGKDALKIK